MGQPVQQQSWSQRCRGLPPAPPRRLIRATSSQLLSFPQFLRKKPKTTAVWSLLQRKGGYLEVQCSSKKNNCSTRGRGRWRKVLQGGGHHHPRRHHPRQALHRAREARLLGQQDRPPAHRALQGDRQVRQHLGEVDPRPSWNWHRLRPCSQEAAPDGWH